MMIRWSAADSRGDSLSNRGFSWAIHGEPRVYRGLARFTWRADSRWKCRGFPRESPQVPVGVSSSAAGFRWKLAGNRGFTEDGNEV